ncbi:Na+-driven multidrug efflux pump [Treponema primitia ZAS-2]|uniref:Multidrug export protein MepA n=1 Tax=Treponema primitia (strain ATCC BAA-887 / DSM 12427 / ZAS-2) TaxID=545694 RepID=F5YQM8_TREPZ|nr:MATE family efflux transporter [Treponema primitia]AEF85134.1 Na+-driven multidrug efflux pump [Treponema primitia ZAS-2]
MAQMGNKNLHLMESTPVWTAIIRLALPMMFSMIAQLVYNMTDTFFIGQTGDPNMVAGISLAMPLFMVSQGIGNIFGVGASSYISRMLGAREAETAKRTNAVSFYTTIMAGFVITIALLLFRKPILHVIGTSDATFVHADSYFSIISSFIVIALLNISLAGQIRSEGATDKAMVGTLIGIIINIILDPVFISVLNMGTAGAAWATVIGQAASLGYLLWCFISPHTMLSIHPRDFKPSGKIYREILKIGLPAALSNIVMSLAMAVRNLMAASYGDMVIAGMGVTIRVESLSFMLIMALAMGYQPFAGFNYGAKNYGRLKKGMKITLVYTTALALFFVGVFALAGRSIIALFINDAQTIAAGATFLHAFLFGLPVMGIQMTIMITFQALGKPVLGTIVSLGRQCLFYIPLVYVLNHFSGFEGFVYSQPLADIATTVVALILVSGLLKELKHHEK